MIKRWVAALALVWLPTLAWAGGGGDIKLYQPVDGAAVGETKIYVQALQHGVTPVRDAKVSVSGTGPNGEQMKAEAVPDPALGDKHVYVATFPFTAAGTWSLTARAEHGVVFRPMTFTVEVAPAPASTNSAAPTNGGFGLPIAVAGGAAGAILLGWLIWRRTNVPAR